MKQITIEVISNTGENEDAVVRAVQRVVAKTLRSRGAFVTNNESNNRIYTRPDGIEFTSEEMQ